MQKFGVIQSKTYSLRVRKYMTGVYSRMWLGRKRNEDVGIRKIFMFDSQPPNSNERFPCIYMGKIILLAT